MIFSFLSFNPIKWKWNRQQFEYFYRNKRTKKGEELVTKGDNYVGCSRAIAWFAISFTLNAGVLKILAIQFNLLDSILLGCLLWNDAHCSYSLPGNPWSNMLMQQFFARQSMVKLYSCSYSLPGSAWSNYVHTTILCPGVHPKIMLMRQLLFLNICACHCAFCVLKIRSLYLISITVHWQCVGLCYLS